MKTKILNNRLCLLLSCLLCAILTGCTAVDVDEQIERNKNLSFRLNLAGVNQSLTKSVKGLSVRYLIAGSNGVFLDDIQSDYHAGNTTIVIEPLPLGEYKLFVLAYDKSLERSGFRVADKPMSTHDVWFSFVEQGVPFLSDDALYYGVKEFVVSSELVENQTVDLSYVLAGVDVDKLIPSAYLRNSIQDIEVALSESARFYSSMSVNGLFDGEVSCMADNRSLKNKNAFYLMPQVSRDSVRLTLTTTTKDHRGGAYQMTNTTSVYLKSAAKSEVTLDLSAHPDSKNGVLYVSKSFYDEEERPLILQDNESKTVYYDEKQRSFRIDHLLQMSRVEQLSLQSRFYSPVPIKDVTIWSSADRYGERVLLAYYDSIPAFSDAQFAFSQTECIQEFMTESKSKVQLTKDEIATLLSTDIEVECTDPYWLMLKEITPDWYIRFSAYGGDPDASNGSPVGNWMGMRPVHIREGIAFLINFGYMISKPDFATYLAGFQGDIWGNGGREDILDVQQIIPQLNARPGFNLGLVYAGNGVVGLGGGWTLGVYQQSYFQHYFNRYAVSIFLHELGHCLGYSHSSGMTYGPWAESIASNYYVNNCQYFPVSSAAILNSANNPNRY